MLATPARRRAEHRRTLFGYQPDLPGRCRSWDRGQGKGDGATLVCASGQVRQHSGDFRFRMPAASAYTTSQIQTIDGLTGGNKNLKPEKADTFTAGVVVAPTAIRNLSLRVDYYHIKVKNAIGIIGQQVSVSQCYTSGDPLFCNNVIRNSAGYITRVNAINLNTGSYLVSGLDTQFDYRFKAGFLGQGGTIAANVFWNHSFQQQQTPIPVVRCRTSWVRLTATRAAAWVRASTTRSMPLSLLAMTSST
jgi:hypothetical protein